jgi:hypothetical protein
MQQAADVLRIAAGLAMVGMPLGDAAALLARLR